MQNTESADFGAPDLARLPKIGMNAGPLLAALLLLVMAALLAFSVIGTQKYWAARETAVQAAATTAKGSG